MSWQGQLTPRQQQVADEIVTGFSRQASRLLWAVTGAGKTEMLFPGIATAIKQGLRVAVASPRVDVCLELAPRLKAAFSAVPQVVLYGDQPEPYHYTQLVICTTHQLLRFRGAFDVVIIDEVDAFPFKGSTMLTTAVKHARKEKSAVLYLTATPGEEQLRQIRQKTLALSQVPLRFHNYLLPEITLCLAHGWRRRLNHQRLPSKLVRGINQAIRQQHGFLLFVPHIEDLIPVQQAVLKQTEVTQLPTVYAADSERQTKVMAMRDRRVQGLVTTTIMERGVTFPEIDVFALGADDAIFSSAALVQMAGRAGRLPQRPTGNVWFFCEMWARNVVQARHQIRQINYRGRQLGGKRQ